MRSEEQLIQHYVSYSLVYCARFFVQTFTLQLFDIQLFLNVFYSF